MATAPYDELAAALHGELIRPEDSGYDQARAVYNAMVDRRPAAIARCLSPAATWRICRVGSIGFPGATACPDVNVPGSGSATTTATASDAVSSGASRNGPAVMAIR